MAIRNKFRRTLSVLCSVLLSFGVACGKGENPTSGNAALLAQPAAPTELSYPDRTNADYLAFKGNVDGFATRFANTAYQAYDGEENFAVSPLSVFSALSLAAEGAHGVTRSEILNALGASYEELQTYYSALYREVSVTHTEYNDDDTTTYSGEVTLSNSLWLQQGIDFRQAGLDVLANKYHAYSYLADFCNENEKANQALTAFIKEQTHGLIEKNYELSDKTLLALVNTLYLKDGWLMHGDLPTTAPYTFTNADGSTHTTPLLQGKYVSGRVQEQENYSLFYTATLNNYKLKFILPKDGYTVADVFTADVLAEVSATKSFGGSDYENNIDYYTRCLFPEFEAEYDENIRTLLQTMGIQSLFNEYSCDFGGLLDEYWRGKVYCEKVQHTTKLFVDKTGIEGAAVTVIGIGESAPETRQEVFYDFVIDRAFGFVITTPNNVTLFSGVVEHL